MKLVTKSITISEIKEMAKKSFGNLVKAVVDVRLDVMAVDAELHADQEERLIKNGSKQTDLWGINIYPDKTGDERIEFDSLINLRPMHNNFSRGVDDPKIRQKIMVIVKKLIKV